METNLLSCPWIWMYVAAFLMLMELVTPGFVMFFFGLSAATVGICRFVFGEALDATWQAFAFSAFSIIYLAVLRRWLKRVFAGEVSTSADDFEREYVGRTGKVTVAIAPPLSGRVEIGDAEWTAEADSPLAAGTNVKVVAQRNLTFKVEAL